MPEHPSLTLFIAAETASETVHELRRRVGQLVARGRFDESNGAQFLAEVEASLTSSLTIVQSSTYEERLPEATWRIPRDPTDTPTVALALALDCGIWTNDRDFFGCGLPVWSTVVLRSYLEQEASAS
jgi:predicted nucleic acid-binding protein